jgi:hypothetical protein
MRFKWLTVYNSMISNFTISSSYIFCVIIQCDKFCRTLEVLFVDCRIFLCFMVEICSVISNLPLIPMEICVLQIIQKTWCIIFPFLKEGNSLSSRSLIIPFLLLMIRVKKYINKYIYIILYINTYFLTYNWQFRSLQIIHTWVCLF